MFSFSNTIKTLSSVSALSLTMAMSAHADVTFTELPISNKAGGGLSWMQVSNQGEVVLAKSKSGVNELQGYKWSPSNGLQLIANHFYASILGATSDNGQYLNISNDGSVTRFGNDIYLNGELVLTTNTGSTKHASSLAGNGNKVSLQNGGANPSILDISTGTETLIPDLLPRSNYIISDFSSDAQVALLSPGANFLNPSPFFIKDIDGSLIEIDYPYGLVNDLSGDGSTVIGRSFTCLNSNQCTLMTNAAGTNEIASDGAYFPQGLNYDGTIAILSFRDYANNDWQGFTWDATNGLRNIVDLLASQNIDISGWSQVRLSDISDNGFYIVGEGINPQGVRKPFIINATPQCAPNGLF